MFGRDKPATVTAFVVGHKVFPGHWVWPVLTAFIVSSGNRGRADVVYKGAQRLIGALAGTLAAGLLFVRLFAPGAAGCIVAIFLLLMLASWLRPLSYGYWAACITAALAFLYGYLGEGAAGLLQTRLEGILCGGLIAIAAAWIVLPLKSGDVLRLRTAAALAALSDFLTALRDDPAQLPARKDDFICAVRRLELVAAPLQVYRRLSGRWQPAPRPVDALAPIRQCLEPAAALAACWSADASTLRRPRVVVRLATVLGHLTALRRAMTTRSAPAPRRSAVADGTLATEDSAAVEALDRLQAALDALAALHTITLPPGGTPDTAREGGELPRRTPA
jgi:uncharacterized membrane protein YccC